MRLSSEFIVNLNSLAHNFNLLKEIAPNNEIIFMVKANAYGHGILDIVYFSFTELKIKRFGCATLGEAIEIRKSLPNLDCELWVFSDVEIQKYKDLYLEYNIVPVLSSLNDLKEIYFEKSFERVPKVIKLNAGMNRLGIAEDEFDSLIDFLKANHVEEIDHLMMHFSQSFIPIKEGDRCHRQYNCFKRFKERLGQNAIKIKETSVSNSGAIEQGLGLEETHIRPGLMLYGPRSVVRKDYWKGIIISSLVAKVLKISKIEKGVPVGYGGQVTSKSGHMVYVNLGYGDGLLTFYSGAEIVYKGLKGKVFGRVNMDLTSIFFEEEPTDLVIGSEFTIWGDGHSDIMQLSEQIKTIPYQLFTAITHRVPRRYIN